MHTDKFYAPSYTHTRKACAGALARRANADCGCVHPSASRRRLRETGLRPFSLRDGLRLSRDQVIGDGANDLAMMAEAGVSIAYHAKPVVREKATYCFDYVGLDGLLNLYA